MEWTGERVIPGKTPKKLYEEHLLRYRLVAEAMDLRGKTVLDAPCGTGYGAMYLAMFCKRVVGADISAEAVEYAQKSWQRTDPPGIRPHVFACCDIAELDGPGGAATDPGRKFDIVVCFEGIEHVNKGDGRRWLKALHNVMADSGSLFISTPHPKTSKSDGTFHKHEYMPSELAHALSCNGFEPVQMWAQRIDNPEPVALRPDTLLAGLDNDITIKTLIIRAELR